MPSSGLAPVVLIADGLSTDRGIEKKLSVQPGRISRPSEYYDDYWSSEGFNPEQGILSSLRTILEREVRPGDACLDVGCGPGRGPGAWIARHVGGYAGVDVSRAAVDAARELGLSAEQIEDASRLPYADASFDLVVCLEVLEHLLELHRRPRLRRFESSSRGRLLVTVPNVAHWRRRADLALAGRWNPMGDDQSALRPWRDPHLRFFGLGNLVRMLEETGFEVVGSGGFGASGMTDFPVLRRLMRDRDPGPVSRCLTAVAPALFAHHLFATAIRPAGG